MTPEERAAFLGEAHTGVFATTGRDGRIHAVPVWYSYDGERIRIITERGSVKHRNAVRTGRAALCVDDRVTFRYVTAEGPVTVQGPVSYEERLALHVRYRGEAAARRVVDQGGHERMVTLILHPEHWLG